MSVYIVKQAPVTAPQQRDYRLVTLISLMFAGFFAWAVVWPLAEVSSGQGTVIPISREQVIQSLEGGIIAALNVQEGSLVEEGQVLAQLDQTRSASNMDEVAAKYRAATAAAARLRAELAGDAQISFPAGLDGFADLRANEEALFTSRRDGLEATLAGLTEGLELIRKELEITNRLQQSGAASRVELIRLQREEAQTLLEITRLRNEHDVQTREALSRATAEAEVQASVMRGRADQLDRLTIHAPMRGVVQNIVVTTLGGVIPPNGQLMTIVPLGDQLLIEARISPRDIAFIHPGQNALVKISAYDYAVFGGLRGQVETISANSVRDELKPDVFYYRVYIRTETDHLVNKAGKAFPIVPGMIATVDIRTGEKTVWQYLVKPFNRAQEALRER